MQDEDKKFNFDVSLKGDNPTLTILQGESLKVNYPIQETLKTTIDGPFKYFEKVGVNYPDVLKTAVVQVHGAKGEVMLTLNAKDVLAAKVTGHVRVNTDLDAFGINVESSKFTGEELAKKILAKGNVLDIPVKERKAFANKFKNFSASVTKKIEKESDDIGNILDSFIQKVTVENLPEEIPFDAMLHLGCPKHQFTVNVGMESTGRNIVFFLYSPEYTQALQDEKEALLEREVAKFGSKGVCVVEVF